MSVKYKRFSAFCLLFMFCAPSHAAPAENSVGRIVCKFPVGEDNPRNGEGDFIRLNNGSILFAYSRFSGKSHLDHAPATIAARVSADEGETWSKDFEIVPREGKQNVMSVSFLRLDAKRIALFYARKNSDYDRHFLTSSRTKKLNLDIFDAAGK